MGTNSTLCTVQSIEPPFSSSSFEGVGGRATFQVASQLDRTILKEFQKAPPLLFPFCSLLQLFLASRVLLLLILARAALQETVSLRICRV